MALCSYGLQEPIRRRLEVGLVDSALRRGAQDVRLDRLWTRLGVLYSYGLYSYGLYSYGLFRYALYSYGPM